MNAAMKKHFLLFILFITIFSGFAQDSIYKTNGEIIAAKITEITPTEVKYKKFTFLDGPTYVENKTGIKIIRFANGLKEEFAPAPASPPAPVAEKNKPAEPPVSGGDYYDPNSGRQPAVTYKHSSKITSYGSAKYIYQDRRIGEREMQGILMRTQDTEIMQHVRASKKAHALQFVGFAAIPLGIAALGFLGSSVDMYGQVNQGKLVTSGVLLIGAIACPIFSGINKHKRTSSNRKAVELYNQKY
ncbi:MAG: hypothetical protein K0S44_1393 [Bacteroidetes bacterium]|jgi:hypothetical protein|nr:hypothetical protein [Bacteroidota bacterium]